jgi:isovaleryl-CoA dehydrogenase
VDDAVSAEAVSDDYGSAFALSTEQQGILHLADQYGRDQLFPLASRMDDEEWWPEHIFPQLGRDGYLGITVPEFYGGVGADLITSGLVLQAFSRWNHALGLSWVAHENLCLNNIYQHANEEQRGRFLPGLCEGHLIGALGLTEPGAGSDVLGSMRTTAKREADYYILNGTKIYITNGPVADVILVYAKTAPDLGTRGISAFVVEKSHPGFRVAQKLEKMGFRGSQTAELVFDDCRVPVANRIGAENEGTTILMSGLDLERAMIAPICLGVSERALEISLEYARSRKQFGTAIAEFQMIRSKLAEMYVRVETMRTFVYRVLAEANTLGAGAGGRGSIHALTAASVMYASEAMRLVLDDLVQIHGGSGYIWESEANRLFRASKLLEIGAGTTEIRKLIISGEIL